MEKQTMMFEEAMTELEKIVQSLETGEVPLEQAMELYQRGMELSVICQTKLQDAEKKMTEMMKRDQSSVEEGEL